MNNFFIIAIVVLIFLVIFQISKASEYVSILKGEEKSRKQNNKINGFLMIAFLILGLIGVWWCNDILYPESGLKVGAASSQGKSIDEMMWITIIVTALFFLLLKYYYFGLLLDTRRTTKRNRSIFLTIIS